MSLDKKIVKIGVVALIAVVGFCVLGAVYAFTVNWYVETSNNEKMVSSSDSDALPKVDAVIVLGAKVHEEGRLSGMLEDRVVQAYTVYTAGKADKILLTGDHGTKIYDEVNAMKEYVLELGVPAEDIFLDHAGFETYDSLYRAHDIFEVEFAIVVTQAFHLPRAVYIGNALGIDTYGISADLTPYPKSQLEYQEKREFLARNKAFLLTLIHKKPRLLGETIPITGDSRKSWD